MKFPRMSGGLDRLEARRRGQRSVVTKHVQEVKSLIEVESLENAALRRLKTISRLLEEKAEVLRSLDKQIIKECPTEEIEREIEEIKVKIVDSLAEIYSVNPITNITQNNGNISVSHESSELKFTSMETSYSSSHG